MKPERAMAWAGLALSLGALVVLAVATPAKAQLTQEEDRENWLAALSDLAWLLWLVGAVLTQFVRIPPLRILCDLIVGGGTFGLVGDNPPLRLAIFTLSGLLVLVHSLQWSGLLPKGWN